MRFWVCGWEWKIWMHYIIVRSWHYIAAGIVWRLLVRTSEMNWTKLRDHLPLATLCSLRQPCVDISVLATIPLPGLCCPVCHWVCKSPTSLTKWPPVFKCLSQAFLGSFQCKPSVNVSDIVSNSKPKGPRLTHVEQSIPNGFSESCFLLILKPSKGEMYLLSDLLAY